VIKAVTSAGIAYATTVTYTTAISDSVSTAAIVPTVTIISTATIVSAAAPIAAIPRAGADKDAAHEPARSVVAVRCASVGVIVVIAPRADWGGISIAVISVSSTVPNPNTYTYLGVSRSRHQRCGDHQRTEQQEIS
jgi:hypothetical protein